MEFPNTRFKQQLLVWWGRLDEERQQQVQKHFAALENTDDALHQDLAQQLKRTLPRAVRAELRRADTIFRVSLCAGYQQIYRQMCNPDTEQRLDQDYTRDRLAVLIGVLVHAEKLAIGSAAHHFASVASDIPEEGDKPVVSPLRFERLLSSPDLSDLFTALRRMLPLLEKGFDLESFSADILHWNDLTRKKWAYTYRWPEKIAAN